ncbi:DUF934 domain-containing protein [Ponticaulis sp.]|uniref:DUF934 domain-containing protein n=1 Tax=Ponticaulis sp. TaxID=2020902 RepID=UPI000B6D9908|nr:DUF934 domain-containing protein [Ponticaulis sp.]OUX98991.1 MAG: hypothetical protein CBB65_10020 [Hyphomonadaceae bacterium TMED5]|tara:strand:+ start:50578 stop:51021 length:444 start_codon:yes stop_codon:yes gene_type:complete
MPLIKKGEIVAAPQGEVNTLDSFLEIAAADPKDAIMVRLMPDDDPLKLEPYLDQLEVVEISFPRYADGRGYSQAQLLRRRLGFKGEIRAVGDVLRDQLLFMLRSGFDAFEIEKSDAAEAFAAASQEYSQFYQPAADGEVGVFARRHS